MRQPPTEGKIGVLVPHGVKGHPIGWHRLCEVGKGIAGKEQHSPDGLGNWQQFLTVMREAGDRPDHRVEALPDVEGNSGQGTRVLPHSNTPAPRKPSG